VEPIAVWNPVRDVWETGQGDLLSGQSAVYSETWPTRGTTLGGRLYAPPTSAPPTAVGVSSSSPTPTGTSGRPSSPYLATPTANLATCGGSQPPAKRRRGGHSVSLADQVEHLHLT
jgi:hypothetical protein